MAASCESIINFLITVKSKLHELYLSYYRNTQKPGLKKLLLSMIDQEKEQEKALHDFKKEYNLNTIFLAKSLEDINLDNYKISRKYSREMEYRDFLLFIIEQKEKSVQLYKKLIEKTSNIDIKYFFSQLSDETNKHKTWAQDRYDLDMLA